MTEGESATPAQNDREEPRQDRLAAAPDRRRPDDGPTATGAGLRPRPYPFTAVRPRPQTGQMRTLDSQTGQIRHSAAGFRPPDGRIRPVCAVGGPICPVCGAIRCELGRSGTSRERTGQIWPIPKIQRDPACGRERDARPERPGGTPPPPRHAPRPAARHVTPHGRPRHDGRQNGHPQPQNDHLDTQRPGSRPGTAHPISPTPQTTPSPHRHEHDEQTNKRGTGCGHHRKSAVP